MSILNNKHRHVVLLAEDNESDAILMRESIKLMKLDLDLWVVTDGEECLAFLRKQGKYANAPTPSLLFLDLNMPRKGGREVMAEIAVDEHLQHLPVVILTTSMDDDEIRKLYKLRCSSYIVKPVNFEMFLKIMQSTADYWFHIVSLPK